ncbi:hypothetical protein [Shewanella sp.]|uniref:hypothetical protein n=1 Tax=Shewanella sp. TaxID=50422 RepID=UPI003A98230A
MAIINPMMSKFLAINVPLQHITRQQHTYSAQHFYHGYFAQLDRQPNAGNT